MDEAMKRTRRNHNAHESSRFGVFMARLAGLHDMHEDDITFTWLEGCRLINSLGKKTMVSTEEMPLKNARAGLGSICIMTENQVGPHTVVLR